MTSIFFKRDLARSYAVRYLPKTHMQYDVAWLYSIWLDALPTYQPKSRPVRDWISREPTRYGRINELYTHTKKIIEHSAQRGNHAVVDLLIDVGSRDDEVGRGLYHSAASGYCRNADRQTVLRYVQLPDERFRLIVWLAEFGRHKLLRELLDDHTIGIDPYMDDFMFAIKTAGMSGCIRTVDLLMDMYSVCVDVEALKLAEAMKGAAVMGHLDLVRVLFDRGARQVRFPYQDACYGGHMNVIEYLYSVAPEQLNVVDCAVIASEVGHPQVIQWLVQHGADPDDILRRVIVFKDIDIELIRWLLARGSGDLQRAVEHCCQWAWQAKQAVCVARRLGIELIYHRIYSKFIHDVIRTGPDDIEFFNWIVELSGVQPTEDHIYEYTFPDTAGAQLVLIYLAKQN